MNVKGEKIKVRYDDVYFKLIRCILASVESAHLVQL